VSLASGGILFYYLIPTLISIYTQRLTEMLPADAYTFPTWFRAEMLKVKYRK